jgi:hypothetical protein
VKFIGTPIIVKRSKRLQIRTQENDQLLYTSPDFIRLPSRAPLQRLADRFAKAGRADILEIIEFETSMRP